MVAVAGWSGCRASPPPERLLAEADALRMKYEEEASQRAIEKYRAAMTRFQRAGDLRMAVRSARGAGASYEQLGRLGESLKSYQEALLLLKGPVEPILESEVRSDVGLAQAYVADSPEHYAEAQRHCEVALDLARERAALGPEAKALACLGEVAYHQQRLEPSLGFYRQAGDLWTRLGDPRGEAQASLNQGYVYSDLSRFDEARMRYRRARALWASLGDRRQQAITLVADARLLRRRGEYQEAQSKFEAALVSLRSIGDVVWEGAALTGLAEVYQDMAEDRSALMYWEQALAVFERAGLKSVAIDLLFFVGQSYLVGGDDTKALSRFERALRLAEEMGIPRWKAIALRFIGVVQLVRRQPQGAQLYLQRSLALQRAPESPNDPRLEAQTLSDLGDAADFLGQHDAAAGHFTRALALSSASADRVTEARALFGLARTSMGRGDFEGVRSHVERALQVVESLRTAVESRDLRTSYFASVYRYHELQMDVLMRLSRLHPGEGLAAAAFEASERARARSLLDSLTEAGVDLREGLDTDLAMREQKVKCAFDDWALRQGRLGGPGGPEAAALAAEYRDLERRYDELQAEIRSKSPSYAALARPRSLRLREVQKDVLDADTLLLEYALGDERSYLWAVSREGLGSHELPPRAEIERQAQRVHERLTARLSLSGPARDRRRQVEQADAEYGAEAARLGEMLLGPVAKKMAGKRILVVADGALQYVPFAALPVPGRSGPVPMVVEHEIVNLPSAAVLAMLRRETMGRKPPPKAVAVLADPVFEADDPRLPVAADRVATRSAEGPRGRLPGYPRLAATRQEADAIVAMAPPGMALRAVDFEASRATATSPVLAQYRIVHFATHGVLDNETPGLSGVVLSMYGERGEAQDGVLRLHDIYELHLPAELVVLSACNTALGRPVRGEGLVGIVRGFMYAGAKRVVASLWKVDDDATGEMMRRFYQGMLEKGLSPAAALREAQVDLWRHDRWRPPYYWAAFVLQGEWR